MEHRSEAGLATLDEFDVDHVGVVDARLWAGLWNVVDLDNEGCSVVGILAVVAAA